MSCIEKSPEAASGSEKPANLDEVKSRNSKRSYSADDEVLPKKKCVEPCSTDDHSRIVADHYNHLEEKGLKERFESPIFYLRNFNNWVKSVLVAEYKDVAQKKQYGIPLKVLDICCGKGGDIAKWQKNARVSHVVFADVAEVSVKQCQKRYEDMRGRSPGLFSAEFITADCTRDTLRDKYEDPSIKFDLVSCQFGLHYSFESLSQARIMLTNISECLKPGGFFFGTIPNADEIVTRAKKSSNGRAFGNRVFEIKLLFDPANGYPPFGAKYDFHLEGVVDCPEFLVDFKILEKLAVEYGLELVDKLAFADFFNKYSKKYKDLLNIIKCFERYPPRPGVDLIAEESEYEHAKEKWEAMSDKSMNSYLNTMSKSEWEVANIYMVFGFRKCEKTWDSNGKMSYITSNNKNVTTLS